MGSPFELGLAILVVFSILQIALTTQFQDAESWNYTGFYINVVAVLAFVLVCLIGEALVFARYFDSSLIPIIMTVASFIFGIISVLICTS
jgi:hypothetical protein